MIRARIAVLRAGILIVVMSVGCRSVEPEPPSGPLHAWNGDWEGTFREYDAVGKKTSETRRRLHFRPVNADKQECTIEDVQPDGSVKEWSFRRVLLGPAFFTEPVDRKGEKQDSFEGHLEDGSLLWHRQDRDGLASYREEIIDGKLYLIEGFALTGSRNPVVKIFSGRYERVTSSAK